MCGGVGGVVRVQGGGGGGSCGWHIADTCCKDCNEALVVLCSTLSWLGPPSWGRGGGGEGTCQVKGRVTSTACSARRVRRENK